MEGDGEAIAEKVLGFGRYLILLLQISKSKSCSLL